MELFGQLQAFVHGSNCTLVVPSMLLGASALLLGYRHLTQDTDDMPLNGFLANILLQMMPLVALKAKIWSCSDRISLLPMVLLKTLLMHLSVETLRLVATAIPYLQGKRVHTMSVAVDASCFCMAVAILHYYFNFTPTPAKFLEHVDVRNLVGLAVAGSFASEAFFVYVEPMWMTEEAKRYAVDGISVPKALFTASNYVDIIAFMPVLWRFYQAENEHEDCNYGTNVSEEAKKQIHMFFLFVFCFYAWDDVIDPVMSLLDEPIAMMAHAAHFMLLLDFCGFFLFQAGNPMPAGQGYKERGEQLQGLLSDNGMEDDC